MSVVNFTVTKPFEKIVENTIKKFGFTSKAEFFRFAAFRFIENLNASKSKQLKTEFETWDNLSDECMENFDKKLKTIK